MHTINSARILFDELLCDLCFIFCAARKRCIKQQVVAKHVLSFLQDLVKAVINKNPELI